MDPITNALEEVENEINPQVLRYAFVGNRQMYERIPINMQSLIRDHVIGRRVLKDCDIKGGVKDYVKLTGIPFKQTETGYRIYSIPKAMTQGRRIITPLAVGNTSYIRNQYEGNPTVGGAMSSLSTRIVNANLSAEPFYTTDIRSVGENLILVEDVWHDLRADAYLLAVFSNDEMMSNLPARYWGLFAELVVLATKAWIYKEYSTEMDNGPIESGVEVGRLRDVIDSYSDANTLYKEMLVNRWQKGALMADRTSAKRAIRRVVPRM